MVQIGSAGLSCGSPLTHAARSPEWVEAWRDFKALAACIKYEWDALFVWNRRHKAWFNRSRHCLDRSKQVRGVDPSLAHGRSDFCCSPSLRAAGPGRAELLPWAPFPWPGSECLVLGGRTGLASIPESCVCSSRAASPSGASAAAGAVPAASPGSPHPRARLLLPASSSSGGWYRLVWPACHGRWKAATAPSRPAPFLPVWSKPVLGCAWCLGSFGCSFLKASQPLLSWPDFHALAVTGRLFRAG